MPEISRFEMSQFEILMINIFKYEGLELAEIDCLFVWSGILDIVVIPKGSIGIAHVL